MSKPLIARPPIGFIVEGHGEYNCYPSLVQRIVGAKGFHIPREGVANSNYLQKYKLSSFQRGRAGEGARGRMLMIGTWDQEM